MKWCVTDAQLARISDAIRDEISTAHLQACQATVEALTERHDAEIARLREDRREELTRLADPHAPFLAHLTELVAILRRDVVHERQRAEVAIDQCRATHLGIGPVTLPPRPEMTAEMPREFTDPELAMMGNPDGL